MCPALSRKWNLGEWGLHGRSITLLLLDANSDKNFDVVWVVLLDL